MGGGGKESYLLMCDSNQPASQSWELGKTSSDHRSILARFIE